MTDIALDRDAALRDFVESILVAAQREWPNGFVTEPNGRGHPVHLYTETHYAWAAVLLALTDGPNPNLLDLAASRLELWNAANGPMTFFNSMAVCLTAIDLRRACVRHERLDKILAELVGRTQYHEDVALRQWCGNNAYLQQVAVDTILLPLARGETPSQDRVRHLEDTFRRYRTPEGFFYDLPRAGNDRERLSPPTYIMKILFLLGVCHELTRAPALEELFSEGVRAVVPLLSVDGQFSYFGRTDNSPFAAGLTIFDLRKASASSEHGSAAESCRRAERFYLTFPRTSAGMLRCNRFAGGASQEEVWRSQDDYAYWGQYSLSSCAYAMLARHWFAARAGRAETPPEPGSPTVSPAVSRDLGVVKLKTPTAEVLIRTHGEVTAWDRRYQGPTILRYSRGDTLVVGAVAKTVSTDWRARPRDNGRIVRVVRRYRHLFQRGYDELDAASVGFLPVLQKGSWDYLPGLAAIREVSPSLLATRHEMFRIRARGMGPCLRDAAQAIRSKAGVFGQAQYVPVATSSVPGITLDREVRIESSACLILDRIWGDIEGTRLRFTVRALPGCSVVVRGMEPVGIATGWGSDGVQVQTAYIAAPRGGEFRYECEMRAG